LNTTKKGVRRGRQRYWCKDCKTKFEITQKTVKIRRTEKLWNKYVFGKQTLRELSEQTGKSKLSIKNNFRSIKLPLKKHNPHNIHLVVDSSFFGKKDTEQWGVVVFRDALKKENLWWKFINEEKISYYQTGRKFLEEKGYKILSTTCDGFRGLVKTFDNYPVQFCHFHQKQIMRRYVTKNPRLEAGIDLKEVVEMLGELPEDEFKKYLTAYINHHRDFLNEKTTDPFTGKKSYTHRRLRSAIRSLQTNLPNLFTYQKYPNLKIPVTTNSLESHFSHIKDVVRIHRGLKRKTKEKLIKTILLNSSIVKKIS